MVFILPAALGLKLSAQYQVSPAEQRIQIQQLADAILSDQSVGELARLIEQEDAKNHSTNSLEIFGQHSRMEGDTAALVDELIKSGEKCTPENILEIAKTSAGKIVWLETGNAKAGFNHIIDEHGAQFFSKGISNNTLPNYIITAVTQGKIVGYQGKKAPRAIYEFTYNGKTHSVAIQVASNGFIVGANPKKTEDLK